MFCGSIIDFELQIRRFHNSVRSTAVLQYGIKLKAIHQLLEMESPKRKGKVRWLLVNEQYIFDMTYLEAGIIHPLL